MGQLTFQKGMRTVPALICLFVFIPTLVSAQDFDGGGFFDSDSGFSFGGDTGITFGEDTGSFFGEDIGNTFGENGRDTGFSFGEDTGVATIDAGSVLFEDFGGFSVFDEGTDAGGITVFGFGGVSGFETTPVFSSSFETFSGPSAGPAGDAPSLDSGPAIIAESSFESPPVASELFFAAAEPAPFVFAGSEPLGVIAVSHAIQPAISHRSVITLAQIPYTGIGSILTAVLFILAILTLNGIAAYFLVRTMDMRRQKRIGRLNLIRPLAPKAIRLVFASW